jgi:hypothetical protein
MENYYSQRVWLFQFALERESGEPITRTTAAELLEHIVTWAEQRDLQVGGGYRRPKAEELTPGPIFPESEETEENG